MMYWTQEKQKIETKKIKEGMLYVMQYICNMCNEYKERSYFWQPQSIQPQDAASM